MSERDEGHTRWVIRYNEDGEPRVVGDPHPYEEGRRMGAEWVIAPEVLSFRDLDEQIEHARLIASAPDLLAALKRATRYVPDQPIDCGGMKCREPWCEACCGEDDAYDAIQQAHADIKWFRSVIAQAEGRHAE